MSKNKKLASLFSNLILIFFLLNSCVGSSSVGVFGSGVSIAFDPRTVGMQIDDSIMQKNLMGRNCQRCFNNITAKNCADF